MSLPSEFRPRAMEPAVLQSILAGLVYPILVTRMFPSVYVRGRIELRVGAGECWVARHASRCHHPTPIDPDGPVSAACREFLIDVIQAEVRRTGFRMCLVWAADREAIFVAEGLRGEGDHDFEEFVTDIDREESGGRLQVRVDRHRLTNRRRRVAWSMKAGGGVIDAAWTGQPIRVAPRIGHR